MGSLLSTDIICAGSPCIQFFVTFLFYYLLFVSALLVRSFVCCPPYGPPSGHSKTTTNCHANSRPRSLRSRQLRCERMLRFFHFHIFVRVYVPWIMGYFPAILGLQAIGVGASTTAAPWYRSLCVLIQRCKQLFYVCFSANGTLFKPVFVHYGPDLREMSYSYILTVRTETRNRRVVSQSVIRCRARNSEFDLVPPCYCYCCFLHRIYSLTRYLCIRPCTCLLRVT